MDWFYAADGKQAGPVTDAQLDELRLIGRINDGTLVWREGMEVWRPLSRVRGTAAPPALTPGALPPNASLCAECQRPFPHSEMVFINQSWICAKCKPLFVQRMMEGAEPAGGMVWRDGKQLVMRPESPLPDRCVKCNVPADGQRLKRTLYWHPPAYYLLILINLLVYAVVAIIVRKKAVIHVGLCASHRSQRTWFIIASWVSCLAGIAMIIGGIGGGNDGMTVVGFLALLGGAIVGAVKAPVVSAGRIDKDFVRVKGAGREYLDALPEWDGQL